MNGMTHRERVLAALNHQPPDRVPLDLGSHPNASMHVKAYEKLASLLGIQCTGRLMHRWMQVATIDEAVLRHFDIDTRRLALGQRDIPLERDLDENTYVDQWRVIRQKTPDADYYELQESPLAGEITISDIVNYHWPDPHDPGITRGLRERAVQLRQSTDCAINVTLPSPFVHTTQFVRGFKDWLVDCASDPCLAEVLFDAVLDVNLAVAQEILREVGDLVDVVTTADDLGGQTQTLVSPKMYRWLFKSRHKRYFEAIHRLTDGKLLFHTCGSVFDLIDDLIEIGVDALNPVQVSATKMDTASLKVKADNRLAYWGAIDTQWVLPFGTPSEVRVEVRRRIAELGVGGGYVLTSVHNIQPDVPPENVCAMFEAAQELGIYAGEVPLACSQM